jgi:hypothetical protein
MESRMTAKRCTHTLCVIVCVVDIQRDDASSVVEFYRQTGFRVTYMYRPEHPDGLVMVCQPVPS